MHPLRFPNSGIRAKPLQGVARHGHRQPSCRGDRPPARGRLAAAKAPLQGGGRLRPPAVAVAPRARTAAASPQWPATHGAITRGSRSRPRLSPVRATAGRSDR
ncbi:hypothetical protein B296_00031548 [Ensete ventricosum]|uniref:Uncharacterized protein n=1 Tax=Ensete ventricosum TaxID=4639 RepID=A0A426X4M1_ENSVE|nr:hypothetical protein B296_00031548 [Ensete ventricosum]